jgi:cytochrome c2
MNGMICNETDRFSRIFQRREMSIKAHRSGKTLRNLILVVLALGLGLTPPASSQETAQFFKQNCSSCHWIGGGRLIGPDLKNVTQRKGRDWLVQFILDPKGMLDARDPYAIKLQAEAKGAIMIQAPGINAKLANALLDLIEAESKLDSSQFAGKAVAVGPYSEADAAAGLDIFSGYTEQRNGGRACISCHTVNSVGASLGGRLGPDLTGVFDRLQGRTALTAWLAAPPTPTMKSVFKDNPFEEDEIKFLVAYFESATYNDHYNFDSFIIWMSVIFCGLGGSVFGMVMFSGIWGNRFKAVRRPLVKVSKIRGES